MISLARPSMQITITDKRVYFITEGDLSDFHDEIGYYVDIEYSDGSYDTFGPYDTIEDAKQV